MHSKFYINYFSFYFLILPLIVNKYNLNLNLKNKKYYKEHWAGKHVWFLHSMCIITEHFPGVIVPLFNGSSQCLLSFFFSENYWIYKSEEKIIRSTIFQPVNLINYTSLAGGLVPLNFSTDKSISYLDYNLMVLLVSQ